MPVERIKGSPAPSLPPPTQGAGSMAVPTPQAREVKTLPLHIRAKVLPQKILGVFKDPKWMLMIVDLFGIASRSLSLSKVAGVSGYVPYLNIASSPFFLYHTLKMSKDRLKLMVCAASVKRVADTFFWLGRGVAAVGSSINTLLTPFVGGFKISGLTTKIPPLGIAFTIVIPLILIVLGGIGGITQGWALIRTRKVLKKFNAQADKPVAEMLDYLQGPKVGKLDPKVYQLDKAHFSENHFSSTEREEAVQARIQELKTQFENIHEIFGKLLTEKEPQLDTFDQMERVYGELLAKLPADHELHRELTASYKELKAMRGKLTEIVDTVRSEIHRNLMNHAAILLMAAITIAAGILLFHGEFQTLGYGMALGSTCLNLVYVLFDKSVSQKTFLAMERYLGTL